MNGTPATADAAAMNAEVHAQQSRYHSPWTLSKRLRVLGWELCWALLCRWTPKPLNRWRLLWLRAFGATLHGTPFVHNRARIVHPWNLTLHDRACLGDGATAYCLGPVEVGAGATVAQEAYLCSGSHDFGDDAMPLVTAPVRVGADAFVALRAVVLPGVSVGRGTVIGAGAVLTRDADDWSVYAGNPARRLRALARRAPQSDGGAT